MKNLFLSFSLLTFLISCSKNEKNESETANHCPVVDRALVPGFVKEGFQTKYPSDTVITWYLKDSIGYCAYFIQPVNHRKLVLISYTGEFMSEETSMDQHGNFEDATADTSSKIGTGCECEIPD